MKFQKGTETFSERRVRIRASWGKKCTGAITKKCTDALTNSGTLIGMDYSEIPVPAAFARMMAFRRLVVAAASSYVAYRRAAGRQTPASYPARMI